MSPHPVRRGAITKWLNDGHSEELLSDRMDVSVSVLEEHYDARTEDEKPELWQALFNMNLKIGKDIHKLMTTAAI